MYLDVSNSMYLEFSEKFSKKCPLYAPFQKKKRFHISNIIIDLYYIIKTLLNYIIKKLSQKAYDNGLVLCRSFHRVTLMNFGHSGPVFSSRHTVALWASPVGNTFSITMVLKIKKQFKNHLLLNIFFSIIF